MKDQFVIACLESPSTAAVVLPYAQYSAARLKKGIILLNVSSDGQNDWLKQYGLPYVGLKGDWKTAIDGLPTAFGGVLAVTVVNPKAPRTSIAHPATLLRTFADCKIAYLVVENTAAPDNLPSLHFPRSTYLTLDHRRESKEKLIWGSYMVRFFGTKLTVATPTYNDAGLREKVNNNILFLKKIYKSLDIDYTVSPFPFRLAPRTTPDMAVMKLADGGHWPQPAEATTDTAAASTLLIAMTTDKRDRDIGDLLFGQPEQRLLASAHSPILFLNQRDDLYVLCD